MHPPDFNSPGMFNWRDQATQQFLLLIVVAGAAAWMVSYMREVVEGTPDAAQTKAPAEAGTSSKTSRAELPRPRSNPFVAFDSSHETLPDSARESFSEAFSVFRRALSAESFSILADCVRHPQVTVPRAKSLPSDRQVIPAMPLVVGPQFGMTGDLLLTTVRLVDGTERPIVFQKSPEGYKLDWEGLVGWCESDFASLQTHVGLKVHPTLMRVCCRTTSVRAPFDGEDGLSIVISHPAEKACLNAFVPEAVLGKSNAASDLRRSTGVPFTLRISPDRETIRHGWVRVKEIICAGWTTDS